MPSSFLEDSHPQVQTCSIHIWSEYRTRSLIIGNKRNTILLLLTRILSAFPNIVQREIKSVSKSESALSRATQKDGFLVRFLQEFTSNSPLPE
jgi:hypothetical protein